MVPALADQVTAVFAVPLVLAVNCCRPCESMVTLLGEIVSPPPDVTTISAELEPCNFTGPTGPGPSPNGVDSSPAAATVETFSTKLYLPATVGVPVIEPVDGLRARPG